MRPIVNRLFVYLCGGAVAGVLWVLSLWAVVGTLRHEHGPAPVVPPPARITAVQEVVEPPKVIPPPFRVQPPPTSVFDPSLHSSGVGLSAGHREFGGRPQ
jgi:hypothetical protein